MPVAGRLRPLQCGLGVLQKRVSVVAIRRVQCDAGVGGQPKLVSLDFKGSVQPLWPPSLYCLRHIALPLDVGNERCELVGPDARDGCRIADATREPLRQFSE